MTRDDTASGVGPGGDPAAPDRVVQGLARRKDRDQSFVRLFERYYLRVREYFARKVPAEDCADLTQATFLKVYRGGRGFRGQTEAEFVAWLFTIARSEYGRWLRGRRGEEKLGRRLHVDEVEDLDRLITDGPWPLPVAPPLPPDDCLRADERQRRLARAIEELPTMMRHCAKMRLEQGLRNREIATALRLAPGTVAAHLSQARERLRAALADY